MLIALVIITKRIRLFNKNFVLFTMAISQRTKNKEQKHPTRRFKTSYRRRPVPPAVKQSANNNISCYLLSFKKHLKTHQQKHTVPAGDPKPRFTSFGMTF